MKGTEEVSKAFDYTDYGNYKHTITYAAYTLY